MLQTSGRTTLSACVFLQFRCSFLHVRVCVHVGGWMISTAWFPWKALRTTGRAEWRRSGDSWRLGFICGVCVIWLHGFRECHRLTVDFKIMECWNVTATAGGAGVEGGMAWAWVRLGAVVILDGLKAWWNQTRLHFKILGFFFLELHDSNDFLTIVINNIYDKKSNRKNELKYVLELSLKCFLIR